MTFVEEVERDGFALVEGVFPASALSKLIEFTEQQGRTEAGRGGLRNLLQFKAMQALAASEQVRALVGPVLGPAAFAVRGILFDKTEGANWKVPWHQDVTIAVKERVNAKDYGPWSTKAGVLHVQPPASVLEQMLTVRIHLDDCPAANGALRVLPGTQKVGKVPPRGR